jgi:hydroxymethylpyrimidine pyrophosphatase-like HAD family hydrolase
VQAQTKKESMMLVVFDIDGTLANIEHRLNYVRSKPKNWKAFDAGIPNDKVNPHVAEVFHSLRDAGHDIVFASGRSERTRDATVAWLDANGFWAVSSHLYMRKADDFRGDDIVKREILDEMTRAWGRKPDMVFDDRKRVVDMWRRNGIWVFDCNQSGEEF